MPIEYEVLDDGQFIHARAVGTVTDEDFVEYEVAHACDERIKSPADELLDIAPDATMQLTQEGIQEALRKVKELGKRCPRRHCAVVVHSFRKEAWDLAKFYEALSRLHAPFSVIVFGNADVANIWLGRAPFHQS
ncbi:MAG: hypothetical protein A2Z25_17370 [Planctomycetes bacterium RBG_16_55_9]|nr:MAG: hypothetical protein A2Z25_17370 [Planctomycetes bacterium RBG_16_55_9]